MHARSLPAVPRVRVSRLRVSVAVMLSVATLGLLGGCAGEQESPGPPSASSPSASSMPTDSTPAGSTPAGSTPASSTPAGTDGASPGAGTAEVKTADGTITWTMPCAAPVDEELERNEEDKKTYTGIHAWRCGEQGSATTGAVVISLVETPADDAAARKAMRSALAQIAPQAKPADNELAGRPGITAKTVLNGRDFAYQGIAVGDQIAFFLTTPPDNLPALTGSVTIR